MDAMTNEEILNLMNSRISQIEANQEKKIGNSRAISICNLKILTTLLSNETYKLKPEISKFLRDCNIFTSGQVGTKSYTGESFVVMSDFHGFRYPIEQIKNYYLYEYDKIYILGDATDRGYDGEGTGSIKNLLEIKKLTEEYPDKVVYIAGNHDHFLMGAALGIELDRKDIKEFGELNLLRNGGEETFAELENLHNTDKKTFTELTKWLQNLPLQKVHEYNGKKYALAHAFFNQRLYDLYPDFCLIDLHGKGLSEYMDWQQVLWFRTDKDKYNPKDCPKSGTTVIIGHTPLGGYGNPLGDYDIENNDNNIRYSDKFNLLDSDGNVVEVKCVDTGIFTTNSMEQKKMLQYDGEDLRLTVDWKHIDTSPGYIKDEEQMVADVFRTFVISSIYSHSKIGTDFFDINNKMVPINLSNNQISNLIANECIQYNLNCDSMDFKQIYSEFKKTVAFDIILENLFDKIEDLEKITEVLLLYLCGSKDGTIKQGDASWFTSYRNTDFLIRQLGVQNIKSIIVNHDCSTVSEYVQLKMSDKLTKTSNHNI